jgi:hypothetical protein
MTDSPGASVAAGAVGRLHGEVQRLRQLRLG